MVPCYYSANLYLMHICAYQTRQYLIELDYPVHWLKACTKKASLQHLTSAIEILEVLDKQCRGKLRNIYAIYFIVQPTQIRQCHP